MARTKRTDSWTLENDTLLAEIVLEHIRNGSTQIQAFEAAAERLQRSTSACGFRWNAEVRKQYSDGIKQAKIQQKTRKSSRSRNREFVSASDKQKQTEIFVTVSQDNDYVKSENEYAENYLDQIIKLAQNQKHQMANITKQNRLLNEQLNDKVREVERLQRALEESKAQPNELTVNEDYQTLLAILQRAGRLRAIEEADRKSNRFGLV